MKRFSDFLVSLILIIMLLPIMIVISIIIKFDSKGPIIYVSYRIGKGGKPFRYFKFRSMFVGSEKVTRFGIFIRRWHLDELPELFLVLTGSMSLVGPRPWPAVKRNRKAYYQSLRVKPGMTGPAQINRHKENTIENVIILNHWYADNSGFLTDAQIIIKTPLAIMQQKNGVTETITII